MKGKTTMKRLALFALLMGACIMPLMAQVNVNETFVKSGAAYANSQNDTTAVLRLAGATLLAAKLTSTDTIAVDVYIQYSANFYSVATPTWTTVVTDSLVYANTARGFAQYSIRDTDSDALDGITGALRTVLVFRGAANGVTTPTYSFSYVYR